MGAINQNGSINVRECDYTTKELMDQYDNLMPHYRKMMRNAAFNLNLINPTSSCEQLQKKLSEIVKNSALDTYGPDHPQAQGEMLCPLKE